MFYISFPYITCVVGGQFSFILFYCFDFIHMSLVPFSFLCSCHFSFWCSRDILHTLGFSLLSTTYYDPFFPAFLLVLCAAVYYLSATLRLFPALSLLVYELFLFHSLTSFCYFYHDIVRRLMGCNDVVCDVMNMYPSYFLDNIVHYVIMSYDAACHVGMYFLYSAVSFFAMMASEVIFYSLNCRMQFHPDSIHVQAWWRIHLHMLVQCVMVYFILSSCEERFNHCYYCLLPHHPYAYWWKKVLTIPPWVYHLSRCSY